MAIHSWDPAKCSTDLLGEFRQVIASLSVGETVELPDGAFVDANERGHLVGKGDNVTQVHDSSGLVAARLALERSNYDAQLNADPMTAKYDDLGDGGRALLSVPEVERVVRLSDEDAWLGRDTVGDFDELVRINEKLKTVWDENTMPKYAVYTSEIAPGVTFEILIGEIDERFWGAVATVLDLSGNRVEGVDCAVRMAVDVEEADVVEDFGTVLEQLIDTYHSEMTGSSPEKTVEYEDPFEVMSIEEIAIQMTKLPFVDYVELEDGGVALYLVNGYFVHLSQLEDGSWQAFTEVSELGERVPIAYYKERLLEALSALLADADANLLAGTEFQQQVQDPLNRNVRFRDELTKETDMPVWSFDLFSPPTTPLEPEIYADNGYTMIIMLTKELVYDVTVRSWDGRLNERQQGLLVEDVNEIVGFFKAKGLDETPTGD